MIIIINNGLIMLQNMPKTDSLYFEAKFFLTISSSKKRFFLFITTKPHIKILIDFKLITILF